MEQQSTICKSVFKSGKNTTIKEEVTSMWIKLINQLERNKSKRFYKKI